MDNQWILVENETTKPAGSDSYPRGPAKILHDTDSNPGGRDLNLGGVGCLS